MMSQKNYDNLSRYQDNCSTLQGINISHLGKRKIIFKMPFLGDMLVPWRVYLQHSATKLQKDPEQV